MSHQKLHPNMNRWLLPPTKDMMKKVIKDTGVSVRQFSRFYGIPFNVLNRAIWYSEISPLSRPLPAAYWHIFYEAGKVAPTNVKPKVKKQRAKKIKPVTDPALLALSVGT